MELIDRYLQAVKFWLPKQQKQDIIAELSDDIHAQIEEQESGLGRKLTDAEVEAILKQRGRPVLVANRYLPQHYLIGPLLFPVYVFVLKVVALCYLVPWFLVWLSLTIYNSSYRGQHASGWPYAVGSLWSASWFSVFVSAGLVTLVFAILERVQAKSRFLEDWDPRKLPPVRSPNTIPPYASLFEFGANLFVCIWMATHFTSTVLVNRPEFRLVLSQNARYFVWGVVTLSLANAVLSAANVLRPYWTTQRAALRLLTDLAGAVLFCWLVQANIVADISGANIDPARALAITNGINWWMARMFPAAVIVGVITLSVDAFRIVRTRWECSPLAQPSNVITPTHL